jgi:hypothetical protein
VPAIVNVVVRELAALERFVVAEEAPAVAQVHRLPVASEPHEGESAGVAADADGGAVADAAVGAGLRAVAPAVQSFAAGRRR